MELHTDIPEQFSILVVDDEWQTVDTLAAILEQEKYIVHQATSGESALAILAKETIDLVLLDVSMGGLDGFETLARIRVHKKTKDMPVIFLTGYMRDSHHMERGFSLGVNEYLVKPIETGELLVRVRSILRMTVAEKKVKQLQSDFFSMLVHDLRGPLTAISAFTQIMTEDKELKVENRVEMLNMVMSASDHMLEIINDILDLSKLESEYVSLNRETIDLSRVIRESVQRMKPLGMKKSLMIEENNHDKPIELYADEQKLKQVMENLIGNAIKFSPEGSKVIIAAEEIKEPKGTFLSHHVTVPSVAVSVTDSGVGIPEKEMPFLFDKYRQLSTAKMSPSKGSGLGLAICKNIVEAHSGKIWVESHEGKGSTFYFCIPKQRPEAE
jgi:signal transduction histidine kinase